MGFSNYVRAVDGTHILILCPAHAAQAFINCKGYFSVILIGIINHHSHFIHIFTSWVGSTYEVNIICNSLLPVLMEDRCYTPGVPNFIIGDAMILPSFIEDPSYPFLSWWMKSYGLQLDRQKEHFKYYLRRCHMKIQCIFSCLRVC
ncbi:hypothetical protein Y1Q_0003157 [Alligator mississippiensis]|uniref:DDE Tnp4 domain-containing protein n=1 Tax=Alligator mississippiensis TaxID=8496 RepID=A0A151MDQ2_ALLMI|nr:hypothetical protein Y1Q_0003157 [Alligator mississippiensis]